MPNVQRLGDANSSGGIAMGGVSSVRVNNRPVMVPGQSVTPHPCCGQRGCDAHCAARTTGGSGTVRVERQPINYTGCVDTCGHVRIGGSTNVRVAA